MKKLILLLVRLLLYPLFISAFTGLVSFTDNGNDDQFKDKSPLASSYASDVLDKWMALQIRLMGGTPASFNGPFVRIYSYSGLAAYHSIFPGIPEQSSYRFSSQQLNQLGSMPQPDKNNKYHWPSSLNAAMAFMNRRMFPAATAANKMAIDSLEATLKMSFAKGADPASIERSTEYGLHVAQAIYNWAETDGYQNASDSYTVPTGPGKWVPTPPTFAKPNTPFWGNLRTIVPGSIDKAQPPAPIPYSEDSTSAFYKEVKIVYDVSQSLTGEQKKIALFWKEINPGISAPGHWLNILRQVIQKENASLDEAASVYALTGVALNDAWISSWKTRYVYNVLRPVTYIREVMKHKDWMSLVPTPPHPEYTSGFAAMGAAVCEMLAILYGNDYQITDHTYDNAGMSPRTYYSFQAMAKEAGDSKMFGGIHYPFSIEAGLQEGRAVAKNIVRTLSLKENSQRSPK